MSRIHPTTPDIKILTLNLVCILNVSLYEIVTTKSLRVVGL